ncbi:MAG TPA: hypothetical protein VF846_15805 [Thermoanaerobaculia bacterium]
MVILDSDGVERFRIEGFLPKREFHAHLEMALARLIAARKRWADAEPRYARIAQEFADTTVVPEALYWRAVSAYQGRRDHDALEAMATEITATFPGNVWAIKAAVWLRA